MKSLFVNLIVLIATLFGTFSSSAQNTEDNDILKIDTTLSRINIYISPSATTRGHWKLTNGGNELNDFVIDNPNSAKSTQLSVVADLGSSQLDYLTLRDLDKGLNMLSRNNILTDNSQIFSHTVEKNLKTPSAWKTRSTISFDQSLDLAIQSFVSEGQSNRQVLLILTDRFNSLPGNIVEQIDRRLTETSVIVYIISVQNKLTKGSVARSNINGMTLVTPSERYLRSVFKNFDQLIKNIYTIWFPLPDNDAISRSRYTIRIEALDSRNNVISANHRNFDYSKGEF